MNAQDGRAALGGRLEAVEHVLRWQLNQVGTVDGQQLVANLKAAAESNAKRVQVRHNRTVLNLLGEREAKHARLALLNLHRHGLCAILNVFEVR